MIVSKKKRPRKPLETTIVLVSWALLTAGVVFLAVNSR